MPKLLSPAFATRGVRPKRPDYAREADRRLRELTDRPIDWSDTSSLLAFGSNGLLDVRMMDSKLGEERAEMFAGDPAPSEFGVEEIVLVPGGTRIGIGQFRSDLLPEVGRLDRQTAVLKRDIGDCGLRPPGNILEARCLSRSGDNGKRHTTT
jgi:hypothetical protein